MRSGFVGQIAGIEIFESSNISVDGSDDASEEGSSTGSAVSIFSSPQANSSIDSIIFPPCIYSMYNKG